MTTVEQLQTEYCPPLDPPTVLAIALDFNLQVEEDVTQFRLTLDLLCESAAQEEESGFDPSGGSGGLLNDNLTANNGSSERAESCPEFATRSHVTDETDLTPALSSLDLESPKGLGGDSFDSQNGDIASGLEALRKEEKEGRLKEIFPSLTAYTVIHTLQKCDGNVDRAMDVLLNKIFFEEEDSNAENRTKLAPRGVDGFVGENGGRRGRRSKNRKGRLLLDERRSSSTSGSWDSDWEDKTTVNKWESARKDVDFITSRTILPSQKVFSVYHASGTSLPTTIHVLAASEMAQPSSAKIPPSALQTQLAELTQTFPSIPSPKLAALLRLSRNSPSAARELAEVILLRPNYMENKPAVNVQLLPIHTPLDFRSEDESESYSSSSHRRPVGEFDVSAIRAQAVSHSASGTIAFSQAAASYRLGKSKPVMGGAVAYYSEEGRRHIQTAKELDATAADAHVAAHSSATHLDLHGVSVQHAVRIAQASVKTWWDGLGDLKYAPGGGGPARDGFQIVTGKGSHSRAGAPKIGPAVLKQLTREGWRVEAGVGYLLVRGIARRK